LHWFLFVLHVLVLAVIHVVSGLAATTKEVPMNKTSKDQPAALQVPKRFALSLIATVWAIGTSATAGALST
jgi:succinate dehydrogenase hydrophobic anchor subunit